MRNDSSRPVLRSEIEGTRSNLVYRETSVARWAPLALMAMSAATPNSISISVISEALREWHYLAHFQPVFDWHSSRF